MGVHISDPEDFARELLARFTLSTPINLVELAAKLDLHIKEVDSHGFEGALIRVSNRRGGGIAVRKSIRELGRKRFTMAHEIGHYILPGHGEYRCKSENIESWRNGIPSQEEAANRFASELLLPALDIYRVVQKDSVTFSTVQALSEQFRTSLTATALRCVEVTDERCAVVLSKNRVIEWVRSNESFRLYIPRGGQLDSDTFAMRLTNNPRERGKDGFVSACAWVGINHLASSMKLWEDSIALPYYNSVLTILTITS